MERNNNQLNLRDFAQMCLGRWWWFVASVVICLCIAEIKIIRTPPVYSRSATLLIKETSNRRSASDLETVLGTGGLNSTNSKLANEVVAFKSPALMEDVVRRADFNVQYFIEGKRYTYTLYGRSCPFFATFPGLNEQCNCAFKVNLKGKDYELFDFSLGGEELEKGKRMTCAAGDTLITPVGVVVISANEGFLGSLPNRPVEVRHASVKSVAGTFSRRLSLAVDNSKEMSDVLTLSFSDVNVQRAEKVLFTLIDIYNENWVKDRNKTARATSEFIDERLASLDSDLSDVDSDISSYKSRNMLPDVSTASSMYLTQGVQNDAKMQELENQLYVSRYILNYLTNTKSRNQMIPISGNITNANIAQQVTNYNTSLLERNKLASNSSEQNPIVVDMDNALDAMRSAIVASVSTQVSNLEAQLDILKKNVQKTDARIAESPNQEKYLLTIGRQQKVKEQLYLYLLQKREENELSQAFTAYNTRIITPPYGSDQPVAPAKKRMLLIALLIGLGIPLAYIYIREALNTKVRGRKDIENLKIPFLGEIPQNYTDGKRHNPVLDKLLKKKDEDGKKRFIVVKKGKRDTINEAFRVLRTNLEFTCSDSNVIVFTSFNVGAGKTYVCANLSSALAIGGEKVLAIDGDLRHASLSSYVDSPSKGLADYLAGKVDKVSDIIVKAGDEVAIDVIPVGTIPPNPAELLNSQRFVSLIEKLQADYKYIMIDCPPVEIVADTQIIDKVADRTVFVVRAGLLDKSLLPEMEKLYDNNSFRNMMLVLNGSGVEGTYYGHYGHYGHYGSYRNYGPYNYYSTKE